MGSLECYPPLCILGSPISSHQLPVAALDALEDKRKLSNRNDRKGIGNIQAGDNEGPCPEVGISLILSVISLSEGEPFWEGCSEQAAGSG